MDKLEIIKKTVEYVKKEFSGDSTGHDWWHIWRVWQTAKKLANKEGGDIFIIEMAALVHDLDDWKLQSNEDQSNKTGKWLGQNGLSDKLIKQICEVAENVSFGKNLGKKEVGKSVELQVVQDADRLDAIGAIGIARAIAYGGHKQRPIYDPHTKPMMPKSFDDYKQRSDGGSSINHFYVKLLLLKDLMNTKTAKKIARKRHRYMESYLDKFFEEWNGQDTKT